MKCWLKFVNHYHWTYVTPGAIFNFINSRQIIRPSFHEYEIVYCQVKNDVAHRYEYVSDGIN